MRCPYSATGHQFSIELSHQFTRPDGSDVEAIPARGDDGTATAATWPAIRPVASPTRPGPAGGSSVADRGPDSLGRRDGAAVRRDRRTRGRCAPRDSLGARRRVTGSNAYQRLDLADNPYIQ